MEGTNADSQTTPMDIPTDQEVSKRDVEEFFETNADIESILSKKDLRVEVAKKLFRNYFELKSTTTQEQLEIYLHGALESLKLKKSSITTIATCFLDKFGPQLTDDERPIFKWFSETFEHLHKTKVFRQEVTRQLYQGYFDKGYQSRSDLEIYLNATLSSKLEESSITTIATSFLDKFCAKPDTQTHSGNTV